MTQNFIRCPSSHMAPSTPTDSSVVKLSSTNKRLFSSVLPIIRNPGDLLALPDKYNYAKIASEATREEFCRPKRMLGANSSKLTVPAFSLHSMETAVDKRPRFMRPAELITPNSLSAASMAERKLDLTDDDVEFLVRFNKLLLTADGNDSSVLFTDEDFIKAFYKWDVESIKSSIGKGIKAERIDVETAYSFMRSSGVKKDIPEDLFTPLYEYYCRRWDGHQNLPVCRCSWVIIQQLNEYKNMLPSAKLA